mmetsp:Transcript_10753/g.28462  ORF Transcript_10753/g.28462 Transcript_10753/m.28462 type:complete len:253 (-) Transcript_10753:884-1642(-)
MGLKRLDVKRLRAALLSLFNRSAHLCCCGEADARARFEATQSLRERARAGRCASDESVHPEADDLFLARLLRELHDMVLESLRVLTWVEVLGQHEREVVCFHAVGQTDHALAAVGMHKAVWHVVVHEVQEDLHSRSRRDLRRALGDGEAGRQPRLRAPAEGRLQAVEAFFEDRLFVRAIKLCVARGIVEPVGAKLPTRLFKRLGDVIERGRLTVDDRSCGNLVLFKHLRKALKSAAIAVVSPALVCEFGYGL